jgi:hypothetical protein
LHAGVDWVDDPGTWALGTRHVVTELDSWYVGSALDAADDAGMLNASD